ncbi:MAG TPA: phosphatase PAP2 family protein [Thermoanaerobaculia bacterium]|nr:phosphatase PAP2 family protein [Thermoanaerobaculia bacterium]
MSANLRACVWFAAIFAVCYGGASWWTSTLPGPLPTWNFAFEQRVPFVPWTAIVYLTITPVLLLAPFLLRERTPMFAFALSVQTIIAACCFLLFPQTVAWVRPEVSNWAFRLADTMNLSYNEFPSLHVAFAVSAAMAYRRAGWWLWAAAVALSTWLMWEHHLADILGGITLAVLVMRIAGRESTWVELCCLAQCARFSRRHIRYFVIFLAIYGPSLLHWRRYRAVRTGFCAAQWIDDLLDGDRPSGREPLDVVDEALSHPSSSHPLARLTRAFLAEIPPDARREFVALVHCMRVDRVRVLGREVWTADQLDAHHRRTFSLSVNLMLHTAGCTARAEEVPSLIDALAWCSVFRDLAEDQRKGLDNIPSGVDAAQWTRESHARACAALQRSAAEIAALSDERARKLLNIFQRSIEKFAQRAAAVSRADRASRQPAQV